MTLGSQNGGRINAAGKTLAIKNIDIRRQCIDDVAQEEASGYIPV